MTRRALLAALFCAIPASAQSAGVVGLRIGVIGSDVAVIAVIPGSAAADAGIAAGDKLQSVDGNPIGSWTLTTISARLRGAPGTEVTAAFQRGDAAPVEYRLIRREPEAAAAPGEAPRGMVGLRLGVVGSDVAVVGVLPGSPAADAGLAVGDKLRAVDGRPIGAMTLAQVAARLRGPAGTAVTASFSRGDAAPAEYRLIRRALAAPAAASPDESASNFGGNDESHAALRSPARETLTRREAEEELLP